MGIYQSMYKEKLCSLEKVYGKIKDNDVIATSFAAMEPIGFLKNLHTIADRINCVTVYHSLEVMQYEFIVNENVRSKFQTNSYFLMEPGRDGMKNGNVNYIPGNLHSIALRHLQEEEVDIFVCMVSPMDEMGYFRTSLSNLGESLYAKKAKYVVLEVNPSLPVIYGENEIHISDVDAIFECDRPYPVVESGPIGETERKIGEYVATLVDDDSTIQLGIGAIPDAAALSLMNKKNLGIHTEMITNSVVDLVESGAVNGKSKTLHRGKIVGAFALGNKRLYDFMEKNPAVEIMSASYVNDPAVIAKNDNMVSINTAITVDFVGQICSESIGFNQYSGSGGQSDTAIGAIHSKNGKSIVALKSTAKKGTVSTIVPYLEPGSIVTLSRNNIDYIVTEHGIAHMKNQTTKQRTENLINIADPKFRAMLTEKAKEIGFLND